MARYDRLLNMVSKDRRMEIAYTVDKVMDEVYMHSTSLKGMCKVVSTNVVACLNEFGIKSYVIDFNYLGIDHFSVVAEYYYNGVKRILIDPTIVQFRMTPKSFLKNQDLIERLRDKGYSLVDDEIFSNYVSLFSRKEESIHLDDYLTNIDNMKKRN